ncbi:hypothetical protein BD770DRAFT_400589 [Pilaira anomala]|nr:hypothetical protein BD770DRAFT_400589 [Pilaira anomala]
MLNENNKRGSSYLFDAEEEEDEVDEWEKEAISSSSKRPEQPNVFARQIEILDEQYSELCDTTVDLEQQLKALQSTLQALDEEELELLKEQDQLKKEYIQSIQTTLSRIQTTDPPEEQEPTPFKTNAKLCAKLQSRLEYWDKLFESKLTQEFSQKKIKDLMHEYRFTEFDILNLTAEIEGYRARIQSLDHETLKLNSLPQILPILKTETENYKSEIEKATKSLEELEQESIKPLLIELSQLKIANPLIQDQFKKAIEYVELLTKDLEIIFDAAVKQRAIQLFITFVNQIKQESQPDTDTLENFTKTVQENIDRLLEKKGSNQPNKSDKELELTKKLVDDYFESKKDTLGQQKNKKTLSEKVLALKEYQAQLEEQWTHDFDSCLDAISAL